MTEQEKKSRRRFLADLLFMGGGITAAALLAKSISSEPSVEPSPYCSPVDAPQVMGEIEMPKDPVKAGEMVLPESVKASPQALSSPANPEPTIEGRRVAPEHQMPVENGPENCSPGQ